MVLDWNRVFNPSLVGSAAQSEPERDERWENVYGEIKDLAKDPLSMEWERIFLRLRFVVEYDGNVVYTTHLLNKDDLGFISLDDPDETIRFILNAMVESLDNRLDAVQ